MKMLVAALLTSLAVASSAFAQGEQGKGKMTLGPALEFSLPTGSFSDVAGPGVGAMARFEYALQSDLALTANSGAIWWSEKTSSDTWDHTNFGFPILAGVKFFPNAQLFVSGELGVYIYTFTWKYKGPIGQAVPPAPGPVTTKFMLTPGLGYQSGRFEVLARYFFIDSGLTNFCLMLAYNFDLN